MLLSHRFVMAFSRAVAEAAAATAALAEQERQAAEDAAERQAAAAADEEAQALSATALSDAAHVYELAKAKYEAAIAAVDPAQVLSR